MTDSGPFRQERELMLLDVVPSLGISGTRRRQDQCRRRARRCGKHGRDMLEENRQPGLGRFRFAHFDTERFWPFLLLSLEDFGRRAKQMPFAQPLTAQPRLR